jgi:hypothetical protein
MFKFFKNGKEVQPPRRITWHFKGHASSKFESAPEKLEINANFWRKKLGISADTEIIFVENDGYSLEVPTAKITQEDDTITGSTTNNTDDIVSDNGTHPESSISEDPKTAVDLTKPKSRKKAVDVSDMPAELDNLDNPTAE